MDFKKIEEAIEKSSPEIKALLFSEETGQVLQDIAEKNNLEEGDKFRMIDEIAYIILGLKEKSSLAVTLKDMGIPQTSASSIEQEINGKIISQLDKIAKNVQKNQVVASTAETITVAVEAGPSLIENLHDENSAENIRQILKANSGEDREKLIENQLQKLPEELQEAIQKVPWRSVVKEIALLNKLDLSQIVAVERETMFVIYGFEDEKNYLANIMREAKLEEPVAVSITAALNERVFKVIVNKVGNAKPAPKNVPAAPPPAIPSDIHPMVEKGEVAHEVPHVEQPAEIKEVKKEMQPEQPKKEVVAPPVSHYPDGKDPYREPIV